MNAAASLIQAVPLRPLNAAAVNFIQAAPLPLLNAAANFIRAAPLPPLNAAIDIIRPIIRGFRSSLPSSTWRPTHPRHLTLEGTAVASAWRSHYYKLGCASGRKPRLMMVAKINPEAATIFPAAPITPTVTITATVTITPAARITRAARITPISPLTPSETITPADTVDLAEAIKPAEAETIRPAEAKAIKPAEAETIRPAEAEVIKPAEAEAEAEAAEAEESPTRKQENRAYYAQLGAYVGELRKEAGLTQASFARELDVSQQTVFAWELGERRVSLFMLLKIGKALGLPFEKIAMMDCPTEVSEVPRATVLLAERIHRLSQQDQRVINRLVDALLGDSSEPCACSALCASI